MNEREHTARQLKAGGGNSPDGCILAGRLVPPSPGWHDLCLRVYSPRGCSPCVPQRARDGTICPKVILEY